ncbi:hypothetical protein QFZ82_002751 [Streptomyces sp. V4I23]|uniref:hypothetical protein n=1 Tax=Streptomyces sp. V4I23 TaxID=3042282 RepID=UPI00278B097A|nr:hypothetical protein [Streptomyces sp. V4I23]MDQ1008266.1 hypothetical protein [Streptomyces sp. V4I23]
MIVTLIVVCEVGFWVLLAAGLATRYLLKMPRTGAALLLCEPLLEVVLLVATAVDLESGAEPSWKHGLAALYIGYTVGHGHRTVKWLDGHAAHRFGGAPPPAKPPRYGMARAKHEGRVWLGTLIAAGVTTVLLQIAIWYVGDASRTVSLESWMTVAWQAAAIHGLIALSYALWPKKAPKAEPEPEPVPAGRDWRSPPRTLAAVSGVSGLRPGPTERRRPPCSPSSRG